MDKKKIDIESIKKQNVHQVPDGYFDKLPLRIQSRINSQNENSQPVFITRMQLKWSLTAALLIFLVGWFFYPQSTNHNSIDTMLADIDSEYIIEYLYEEDISTDEILAAVDDSYIIDKLNEIESEIIDKDITDTDLESIYSELDFSTEIM